MKKLIYAIASLALILTGCAKENELSEALDGDSVKVSVSTMLENAQSATKATWDNDGNAACVDHWIMEVYDAQGVLFDRQEKEGQSGLTNTFDVVLIKNQSYKFAFWADTKGMYETSDLRAVKTVSRKAGRDCRDAFFCEKDYKSTKSETLEAKLYRPFHQINIVTTDLDKIYKQMEKAGTQGDYAKFIPTELKLKGETYNEFNVLTGDVSDVQEYELNIASCYADFMAHAAKSTIFMDYGFATEAKELKDLDFVFTSNGEEIAYNFTNIPLQRNYRTNILGNFMSNDAQWLVEIIPIWDGDGTDVVEDPYLVNYSEAGSIAAANEMLAAGENAVSIENPDDTATNSIILPASQDGNDIFLKLSGTEGKTVKVVLGDGAQGPANLYVTADKGSLDISCPNSHVEVNGGEYETITASTSASTLVVGKDVTIATLDVLAGNVEIHGKVASFTRTDGVKAGMYASDRATLINYINWAKAGDVAGLECDINLEGENWTPLRQGNRYTATFDGQGHTISNMTIESDWANGVGFFSDMTGGAVIKNFTMDNASVANTTADKGNMYGIISGYAYGNATFENITVKNSNIHAFGKVAAILGMAADANGTTVVKNCKVENTQIIGCYNVANYVGLVQNAIVLEGCTSTNVEKKLGGRYGEESYVTFDNVKVINNDTENPKYVLSSGKYWEYAPGLYYAAFADCYNDIHYCEWKALDGSVDALVFNTTDAPELKDLEPVATIGSKKYYDLPSALAALQQGETLEIVQAGEYTVETLTTPANITIDAKVDGVVFKHTPVATSWLTNQVDGRTVKNITWNVGTAHHQYLHGVNLVNCKIEGMICTHSNSTYTDCEFYNEDSYNLWEYGTGSTFIGCKFTCPGGPDGKGGVINAYNEGHQEGLKTVILKDCEFIALETSDKYSVMYIKPETDFDIQFVNCTYNDKFCTGDKSGSKLWNVKAHTNLKTQVTVDGKLVYANGTVLDITTADQLMAFAAAVNGGNSFAGKTVYLGADIDLAGKTWIPAGSVTSYPSITFEGTFDGQNHIISNLKASDNTQNYATAGLFGSLMGTVKNVTLKDVNISSTHYAGAIMGYSSSSSVVIDNCSVIGGTITSVPELIGTAYDNGDKCGGIVGYAGDAPCTISNCTVEGVTVCAYRDLGGIAGASNAKISNCSVKNSSIIQDNTNAYKTGIDTYHEILGRDLGATLSGNAFENVTVTSIN